MKKVLAMVIILAMMLTVGVMAFAEEQRLTLEEAKQAALDYAGVKASDASFTKAYKSWDDGREVYEIEFYADNTEYDMDVNVVTGRITDFSMEYHGGYNRPAYDYDYHYAYYDDDWYDDDWADWFDWD